MRRRNLTKSLACLQAMSILAALGCDPVDLVREVRAEATNAVGRLLSEQSAKTVDLEAGGNPWGEGLLVFTDRVGPGESAVWYYQPRGLSWFRDSRRRRGELFAVNDTASQLTPDLRRLANAERAVRERAGLDLVNQPELQRVIDYSIRHGVTLHQARAAM